MSAQFAEKTNKRKFDKKTEFTVYGYIRNIQKQLQLLRDNNPYYIIPQPIIYICLLYSDPRLLFDSNIIIDDKEQLAFSKLLERNSIIKNLNIYIQNSNNRIKCRRKSNL